jgi:SAM-dependent methyltransferase
MSGRWPRWRRIGPFLIVPLVLAVLASTLALVELARRSHVFVDGIDISAHFVTLYNKRMKEKGHAVAGDMRRLPFADNAFDFVYCIVSLMYLSSRRDQKMAISEMLRVLKTGGRLMLIEPNYLGVQIVRVGGLVPFVYRTVLRKAKVETGGTAFHLRQLHKIVRECKGRVIQMKGYPFFTLVLLPAVAIGKISSSVARIILITATFFDRLFPFAYSSYFVTWEIIKK